jgi:glycerol-3-phosphate dehydrogenase
MFDGGIGEIGRIAPIGPFGNSSSTKVHICIQFHWKIQRLFYLIRLVSPIGLIHPHDDDWQRPDEENILSKSSCATPPERERGGRLGRNITDYARGKMMEFSWQTRKQHLNRLSNETFDICIIGGGVTGVGLALDAVWRGWKTVLFERRDFAAGTSSRSTKLLHGGLRYLEHFDFALVREGLVERSILTRIAPHLAESVPFLVPIYSDRRRNYDHPLKMRAGMLLYDLLAGGYGLGRHRRLSREEALAYGPHLDRKGLQGALLYYDGRTDDARLVVEIAKTAHRAGGCLLNHMEVSSFLRGEQGLVEGVRVRDLSAEGNPKEIPCRARIVLNATGIWMEETLRIPGGQEGDLTRTVRPSKGIHLTISADKLPVKAAWLIPSLTGHRFYFVVPWEGRVNIGTTDTDYQGDKNHPQAIDQEVREILGAINAYFPSAQLDPDDVITAWAGLRPLISDPGVQKTTDISRKEEVLETPDGVISIAGGKLTTYRRMAENGINLAERRLGKLSGNGLSTRPRRQSTRTTPLCGGEWAREKFEAIAAQITSEDGLPLPTSRHLVHRYGSETPRLLQMMREDESLRQPLLPDSGLPDLLVEVAYAIKYEMALTLADVLARRTRLSMLAGRDSRRTTEAVASQLAAALGWSEGARAQALTAYDEELEREYLAAPPETD